MRKGPTLLREKDKKTINPKDLIEDPQLSSSSESLGLRIGFISQSVDKHGYPVWKEDWSKHPSTFYTLKTGTPVKIAASRIEGVDRKDLGNLELIFRNGFDPNLGIGSLGYGANFGFDGDPSLLDMYASNWGANHEAVLVATVNLKNPMVIEAVDSPEWTYPSIKQEEPLRVFGGREKDIATKAIEMLKQSKRHSPDDIKLMEELKSGKITFHDLSEKGQLTSGLVGVLAMADGFDALIRINTDSGPDQTHMAVFDGKAIDVLGVRALNVKDEDLMEKNGLNAYLQSIKGKKLVSGSVGINQASSVSEFMKRSNEMADELAKGKTPKERGEIARALAEKYGVSVATVRRAARNKKKLGTVTTSNIDRSARVDEIIRLARLGVGPTQIAKELGLTSDYINVVLRNNNISTRKIFKEKQKLMAVAKNIGLDTKTVSRAFGVDQTTVNRSVKQNNTKFSDLSKLEKGELIYTLLQDGVPLKQIIEMLDSSETLVRRWSRMYSDELKLGPDSAGIEDLDPDDKIDGLNTEIINLINNNPKVLTSQARNFLLFLSNHSEEEVAEKFKMSTTEVKMNRKKLLDALRASDSARPKIQKPQKRRYSG